MESKISRSVYQKVCEENKRLLSDLRLLTNEEFPPPPEYIICLAKWRNKFKREKVFNETMRHVAKQYIKDHADELPDFLTKSINPK